MWLPSAAFVMTKTAPLPSSASAICVAGKTPTANRHTTSASLKLFIVALLQSGEIGPGQCRCHRRENRSCGNDGKQLMPRALVQRGSGAASERLQGTYKKKVEIESCCDMCEVLSILTKFVLLYARAYNLTRPLCVADLPADQRRKFSPTGSEWRWRRCHFSLPAITSRP